MTTNTPDTASRAVRLVRGCALAATATLFAGAAHAGTVEIAHLGLGGLSAYFADPENVRGVFGAAIGAIVSVVVAQTAARLNAGDSDE